MKLLSIDGGGMRGLAPAMVLAELEKNTRKRCCDIFDIIGGTSTGGIIACGLACGIPAGALVEIYEKHGDKIFDKSWIDELLNIDELFSYEYSPDGLEQTLDKYFKQEKLSGLKTELLVTSYDITSREPYFFKSWKAQQDAEDDFFLPDVARATSAAPTYFPPANVRSIGGVNRCLVDGGVFANNPSMCILAEAWRRGEEVELMLSLGTGNYEDTFTCEKARGWGKVGWLRPLLDVMFDGQSDAAHYQCRHTLQDRYIRVQEPLEPSLDMDDSSATAIGILKVVGRKMIARQEFTDAVNLC